MASEANGHDGGDKNTVPVTEKNALRELKCAVQPYAWGRVGKSSMVARLKAAADESFEIDESSPYAELWIGTHPNGMSQVLLDGDGGVMSLAQYVAQDAPLHLGSADTTDLSFLLKVLSVEKVLSIQAHPDKALAAKLHAERPKVYKDANHKPEMAIALSDEVQAMYGFRPMKEIVQHVKENAEFAALLGKDVCDELERLVDSDATKGILQRMFQTYLETPEDTMTEHLDKLLKRLESKETKTSTEDLILRLAEQFPGDSGIFAPLIFNHLTISKGQGFFTDANEPHAYISGEILECMACSDNVVRAGLTPKLKDVPTLVSMLTFRCANPVIDEGKKLDECTTLYQPPVDDFVVEVITVKAGTTYTIPAVPSPSVLLTLSGSAATLQQGTVKSLAIKMGTTAFVSANTTVDVVTTTEEVQLTRALSNIYKDKK